MSSYIKKCVLNHVFCILGCYAQVEIKSLVTVEDNKLKTFLFKQGFIELYVYSLYYKSYTHCVIHLIYIIYPLYIHCQSLQGHWSCGLRYHLFTTSGSISCHAKDKGIFQLILFISFPNCMKSPTILLWDGSGYQNR